MPSSIACASYRELVFMHCRTQSEFSRKIAGITTAVISGITAGGSAGAAARIASESAAGISVLGSGAVFTHVCYCVIRLVDLLQLVVCKILQVTVLIAIGMIFFN